MGRECPAAQESGEIDPESRGASAMYQGADVSLRCCDGRLRNDGRESSTKGGRTLVR